MKANPLIQRTSLVLLCSLSFWNAADKGKQIRMCKIEEGYYAIIREKTEMRNGVEWQSHWLNFEDGWDKNPPFESYNLDSLEKVAVRNYFPGDTINQLYQNEFYISTRPEIHFVNRKLGFLYGTNAVYMYYPFMYRTADGGKSWTLLTAKELGQSSVLDNKGFYMFNEKQGIIVWQHANEGEQAYSLTEDGGITWKLHSFKTGYYVSSLAIVLFAPQGEITLVYQGTRNKKDDAPMESATFKSTDFGRSFRELK